MTDRSRIHPNYREMLAIPASDELPQAAGAVSDTQAQLSALDPGARWSHALSREAYVGGFQAPANVAQPESEPEPDHHQQQ
ncbi:MAG TPA: hypothetical protein VIL07_04640 [Symbiobacteriaceae bacterium]